MAPKPLILIVAVVSAVVGFCLLVTAALTIDAFRTIVKACNDAPVKPSGCALFDYWMAAGCFGLIASLIQMASLVLVFIGMVKPWCGLHVVICILSIVSFAIAVDKEGFNGDIWAKRIIAFTAFCLIDMLFSPIAAGVVYFLDKQ